MSTDSPREQIEARTEEPSPSGQAESGSPALSAASALQQALVAHPQAGAIPVSALVVTAAIMELRRLQDACNKHSEQDLLGATERCELEKLRVLLAVSASAQIGHDDKLNELAADALEVLQDARDRANALTENGYEASAAIILNAVRMADKAIIALERELNAARSAIVPTGWKLVPTEPTLEMLDAGLSATGAKAYPFIAERESGVPTECDISPEDCEEINRIGMEGERASYRAMISAAPSVPTDSRSDK